MRQRMRRFLDDMTVRLSWLLVLATFLVLIVGLSGLGLYAVHHGQSQLAAFSAVNVDQQSTLNRANSWMLATRLVMEDVARTLGGTTAAPSRQALERARELGDSLEQIEAIFADFQALPIQPGHEAMVAAVGERSQALMDEALWPQQRALAEGDLAGYEALLPEAERLNDAFYADAVTFFHAVEAEGNQRYVGFFRVVDAVKYAIVAVLALALGLMALVLWGVTINVIRPLGRVVEHCERIARGDLAGAIEARGRNEIGRLYAALSHMQRGLAATVAQVRRSSQGIHGGTQEIAGGNQDLSARTEQQAASLAETASSMEQLTATVEQNADHARQANRLAEAASRTAGQGGEVVERVVGTMREISDSSHRVTEIIGLIDSIAFQTNILALNASVEAARAGEQGRGFAVVAGEVRNLAGRSGEAARQIRELIEASVARVEAGSALAEQAGRTMGEVLEAVRKVSDIMDEIASASQEQSHGIGQVNQAVAQMDRVTQQNAALVQQAAAAASALEGEAARLRQAVAQFRLAGQEAEETPLARWLPDLGECRSLESRVTQPAPTDDRESI